MLIQYVGLHSIPPRNVPLQYCATVRAQQSGKWINKQGLEVDTFDATCVHPLIELPAPWVSIYEVVLNVDSSVEEQSLGVAINVLADKEVSPSPISGPSYLYHDPSRRRDADGHLVDPSGRPQDKIQFSRR